ncbi:TolC family outer membrane protein [Erwinia sp. HDF1-3R]|uniref:TolC family outer membrane protein n=1 Tax=Erwinia sp. HDF1-3R TaxID=3141543 RepID=UPI0031F545EE
MNFSRISLSTFFLLLWLGHAQALTLQQAVMVATTYDSEYLAAVSLHQAEQQKRYQGFTGLLPEITLTGNFSKQDQPKAAYAAGVKRHDYALNLTQPLFDLARFASWQRSKATANIADANFLLSQQKLIQNVSKAWFAVIFSRKQLTTIRQEKKAYELQLRKAQRALAVGDGTQLDVDEAQASYDTSDANMLSAENDLNHADIDFQRLTGLRAQGISEAETACLFKPMRENMNTVLARATAKNLNIIAASHQLQESRSDVYAASSTHLPVVTLRANYGGNWSRGENENMLDEFFGTTSKTTNTYIGINVAVPIFAGGRNISQTLEAVSRHDRAKQLLEDTRRKILQDTQVAWLDVNNNLQKIYALRKARQSARKKLDSTIYGKEVGLRTLIDEFNAEKELFKAIQNLTEAENNFIEQKILLAAATGDLDYSMLKNYICH